MSLLDEIEKGKSCVYEYNSFTQDFLFYQAS